MSDETFKEAVKKLLEKELSIQAITFEKIKFEFVSINGRYRYENKNSNWIVSINPWQKK